MKYCRADKWKKIEEFVSSNLSMSRKDTYLVTALWISAWHLFRHFCRVVH